MECLMTGKSKFFYGWIVVIFATLASTMFGVINSYSTFIKSLEPYLNASRTTISGAYTLEMAFYALFAIMMGAIVDKYGPRTALYAAAVLVGGGVALCSTITASWQLYIFFGVLAGIGHSALLVVGTTTVSKWFIKSRGLAIGIVACGLGIGLLIIPPVSARIIASRGWQSSFLFLGALAFVSLMIAGTFMKRRPQDVGLQPLGYGEEAKMAAPPTARDYSLPEILRARAFWVIYLTALFCYGAEQMLVVHLVPYCASIGIGAAEAAFGLSCLGIGTILGRVGMGWLSDRVGRVPALMVSVGLQTATTFAMLMITGAAILYPVMIVVGFGYGGWAALAMVIIGDFFGVKNMGKAQGAYFTNGVLGSLVGPLLAGWIFDTTQSYFWAIIFAGVTCAIPFILAFTILKRKPATA
jgi:OFA family oxalate/formate antiporter-like MFS transporter